MYPIASYFFQVFLKFCFRFSSPILCDFHQALSTLKHFSALEAVSSGTELDQWASQLKTRTTIILKIFAPTLYARY